MIGMMIMSDGVMMPCTGTGMITEHHRPNITIILFSLNHSASLNLEAGHLDAREGSR